MTTLVAAALTACALLAGCASSGDAATPPSSTTPPTSPSTSETATTPATTAPDDPAAEVLGAVSGYWSVFFEANDPPDPEHPGFEQFYAGEALVKSTTNASSRRAMGQAVRPGTQGLFRSKPTIVIVDGDRATVDDCLIDDSMLIDLGTGAVLNDAVATSQMRLDLERIGGSWRVVANTVLERWQGVRESC